MSDQILDLILGTEAINNIWTEINEKSRLGKFSEIPSLEKKLYDVALTFYNDIIRQIINLFLDPEQKNSENYENSENYPIEFH